MPAKATSTQIALFGVWLKPHAIGFLDGQCFNMLKGLFVRLIGKNQGIKSNTGTIEHWSITPNLT